MSRFGFFLGLFLLTLAIACSRTPAPSTSTSKPLLSIDPATTAVISGTIHFDGTPPQRQLIHMESDPSCVITAKGPIKSEALLASDGKLQNVFVYVKSGLENYKVPQPSGAATLDQIGCRYQPHILGLMTGQPLRVLNSDRAEHNIHAVAQQNAPSNVSQMPGAPPVELTFNNPELLLPIVCNQHPWMKMYVNVVPHPFFAVSDAAGHFSISGLPPGDYTIEALHEKLGAQDVKIHLATKESKNLDFHFAQH